MNKIIIDGKEYELSDDLAEKIKAEVAEQEKREADRLAERDPFARVKRKPYFLINGVGKVSTLAEGATNTDDELYSIANYCHDRGMMEQRALHETLNRLLWRYSETHGGDGSWEGVSTHYHYHIRRWRDCDFKVSYCEDGKTNGVVYFNSRDVAEAAIDEVVKPFMAAHPEFVW